MDSTIIYAGNSDFIAMLQHCCGVACNTITKSTEQCSVEHLREIKINVR